MRSNEDKQLFRRYRAAQMREEPTPGEAAAWRLLEPLGFARQVSMSVSRPRSTSAKVGVILDFYHRELRLCIEIDGGYHKQRRGPDARRDRLLAAAGILTLRVSNKEILKHPKDVLSQVQRAIQQRNSAAI